MDKGCAKVLVEEILSVGNFPVFTFSVHASV